MKTPNNHTHYWTACDMTIYYRHTGTQAFIWVDGLWKNMPMAEFEHLKPMMTPVQADPEYVPEFGEKCEMYTDAHGWIEAKYVGKDGESPVFRLKEPTDRGIEAVYSVCIDCKFRPLPDPAHQRREELLSKWRSQSQECAHDTEQSLVSLGMVFDFISELEGE